MVNSPAGLTIMTTLYQRRNIYLRQQTTPLIANAVLSGVFFFMTLPLLLVFRALVWNASTMCRPKKVTSIICSLSKGSFHTPLSHLNTASPSAPKTDSYTAHGAPCANGAAARPRQVVTAGGPNDRYVLTLLHTERTPSNAYPRQ